MVPDQNDSPIKKKKWREKFGANKFGGKKFGGKERKWRRIIASFFPVGIDLALVLSTSYLWRVSFRSLALVVPVVDVLLWEEGQY